MSLSEIRAGVIADIEAVAPEAAEAALQDDRPLRGQVDLDSMDWLNVIIGWHRRFAVEIPEADYGRLTTLSAIVSYIAGKLRTSNGPSETTRPPAT